MKTKNNNSNKNPQTVVAYLTRTDSGNYHVSEAYAGRDFDTMRRTSGRNTARLLNKSGLVIK